MDLPTLSLWLVQYGSFFLFLLLALGIIVLPVPEETMLLIAGVLIRHGELSLQGTILAACAGSMCGITGSYLIGRTLGLYFLCKYGKWVGITEGRLAKAHLWFEKFGKWAVFGGYFVPGVRHFTGLSAGATKLEFKKFALFAYSGAALWVSCFLSVGYCFGHVAIAMYENIEFSFDTGIVALTGILFLLLVFWIIYRIRKARKS